MTGGQWAHRLRRRVAAAAHAMVDSEEKPPSGDPALEVDLLVGSPLFDLDWYRHCARRSFADRQAAVEHYLETGRNSGLTPHPLVVPNFLLDQDSDLVEDAGADAFVAYLRARRYELPTHPLFELSGYLEMYPRAVEHSAGPIGHYEDVGAREGARVNAWYRRSEDQPRGLVDWIWDEAEAWAERRWTVLPAWGRTPNRATADADLPPAADQLTGVLSVVLVADRAMDLVARSITTLLGQTDADWELVVVPLAGRDEDLSQLPRDPRIRVEPTPAASTWAARNLGLRLARGDYVGLMVAGDVWLPGRVTSLRRGLSARPAWAHDGARNEDVTAQRRHATRHASRARLAEGIPVELGTVVVARDESSALGGFDESLAAGQLEDLLLRFTPDREGTFIPRLGVLVDWEERRLATALPPSRRPFVDLASLPSTRQVVLNRHLPWSGAQGRATREGLVSIVMPTYEDWALTKKAIACLVESIEPGHDLEILVVDNGSSVVPAVVLAALPLVYPQVRLIRLASNHGFAYGSNVGLVESNGSMVVFLNNDTEVRPGWLPPLVRALSEPEVHAAQPLLLYPDGDVQSLGVVFPRGRGLPHNLLQGHPVEDASGVIDFPYKALTGAALAMRSADAMRLKGFDTIYANGMEDIDLCMRLSQERSGRFVVCHDSVVVHHESRTPGRFRRSLVNRRVFLDRWWDQLPEDDVAAWALAGFDVIGHHHLATQELDSRIAVPLPMLARPTVEVRECRPALRWAIKNPAPAGPEGEQWGDTHFARHLAAALRGLGQEVVIDHRGAFQRPSAWHDDVVLLLRGLAPYTPARDQVNLMWLISHPEMLARSEPMGWDRIFVASNSFARQLSDNWGVPATPLLQATDPSQFHPDQARPDTGHHVLFLGSSREVLRPLVSAAIEADLSLSVIGVGWDGLIPTRYVRAPFLPNAEAGAAYRAAGVVLNDHWEDMRVEGFLSNRLFDAVASGARVVSDDAAGIAEVFGDAVQVVHDAAELAAAVDVPDLDAVFGSDKVRRERAARVAADHSFEARAKVLLDEALRIRSARGLT